MLNEEVSLDRILPAKKPFKLPVVLSQNEVRKMIQQTVNIKHKCILIALYSSGLRVGELINLKIADIDSERMLITVRNDEGAKDRVVPLSSNFLTELKTYSKKHTPQGFLFEGRKGNQYSATSVNQVVKKAAQKVGIHKNVSSHTLRH